MPARSQGRGRQQERTILHVDMDAFFASVEALSHPEVAGKPMAVCGDPASRHGIILAKNQLAKAAGVKTAEPIWQAMRKCPKLILLPPHHDLYAEYCEKANDIYGRFTDMVERAGIDESYLDVTASRALLGDGAQIADKIREAVKSELRLTVSVGVSFCKLFAKLGSDLKKPDGTSVIPREGFEDVVYGLPVRALMSVGGATEKALAELGIRTIGDLAAAGEELLGAHLGKHGHALWRCAKGLDDEPVLRAEEQEDVKSVGNSMTFRRDLVSREDIRLGLRILAESVAYRLRRHEKKCYGVQIAIKDPELKVIDRQTTLPSPTNLAKEIYDTSYALLLRSWKIGKPIRLLAVTAISLADENAGGQLSLFGDPAGSKKRESLERSVDKLVARYGRSAVKPASVLKNDLGIDP